MSRAGWGSLAVLLAGLLVGGTFLLLAGSSPADPGKKDAPGKNVFGLDRVWTFHLTLSADEYKAMQPPPQPLFPGFGPARPPIDSDKNVFGLELPWVVGDFTADGEAFGPAGFRYKGNSTYMTAARGLKRSIKIELDHYEDDYRFHGLKTINLNCSILDPTRIREAISYSVIRAAGYPAPRTAFADVSLTVPGKYDKEFLGLYTIIEQVDKRFLKDHFKNNKGVLLKPERMRGLDYLGEDWARYPRNYQPRNEPTRDETKRIIEFLRLVNKGTDEQFKEEIGKILDVDAFLRFLACNAILSNLDSFFALGHNYYLYLNPETNNFVFLFWDLDLSLGNFAMMATPEQQYDLSVRHPYVGTNKLTERLLALPGMDEKYQAVLKDITAKAFTREKLLGTLDAVEKVTKDLVARELKVREARKEPPTSGPGGSMFGKPPEIRTFIEKRLASVEAQVAGKSKGVVPSYGFPFGGGPDVKP